MANPIKSPLGNVLRAPRLGALSPGQIGDQRTGHARLWLVTGSPEAPIPPPDCRLGTVDG